MIENMCNDNLKVTPQTNWEKVEAKRDEEIDTSDIAPLDETFFAKAQLRMPKGKVAVMINVAEETNDWFQSQGEEYKSLMSAVLRIYAEAHKEIRR